MAASFDYVPVKLINLPLGVKLEMVYFRDADGEFALLCENQTLTEELVKRFEKTIRPSDSVYISRKSLADFFEKGIFLGFSEEEAKSIKSASGAPAHSSLKKPAEPISENARKFNEMIERYDESKADTADFLKNADADGKIDRDHSVKISKDVQLQIESADVSLIIQGINRIRTADEYLHTHCLNVAFLNGLIGKWLKFDAKKMDEIVEIGLVHDLGKLKIDQEVLNKPSRLTPDEFEEIKRHPVLSLEMLIKSGVRNRTVLEGAVQHHEKVNGTGYPYGLNASKISDFARITSISDIYDAMVTKRVYKEPHSPFVILNEFSHEGYSELDINYVKIFIDCMIEELKGKQIVMSDGSIAKVLLVNPRNLLYPIVEIDGKVVTTNEELHCKMMYNAD